MKHRVWLDYVALTWNTNCSETYLMWNINDLQKGDISQKHLILLLWLLLGCWWIVLMYSCRMYEGWLFGWANDPQILLTWESWTLRLPESVVGAATILAAATSFYLIMWRLKCQHVRDWVTWRFQMYLVVQIITCADMNNNRDETIILLVAFRDEIMTLY